MLSLILLVLAAPRTSLDAPPPLLPSHAAVFVSSPDEAAAAKAEADLSRALQEVEVKLTDVPAAFPLPARDESGDKLVKDARQAYDDLDYEGAAAKWTEALEFFVKNPHLADAKSLGDAHFFVGALAIQNGGKSHAKKAQEEFVRGLLNNPDLTCDPQVYGNDVKKAFDKALTEISGKGVGALAIDSNPPGAAVSLRGKELGLTPIAEAPSVPVGRHLLTFTKPGYEPAGAYDDVTREGATAKPSLTAAPGYLEVRDAATAAVGKGVGVKGPIPPGARKLGEIVKSRFLVLSDGATAEVWDVETGNRLAGLSLSAEELKESAKKIGDFINKPSAPVAALLTEAPGEPFFAGPVYKKWWFWTAVGVVAVGSATAIGAAAGSNPSRPFNVVLGIP